MSCKMTAPNLLKESRLCLNGIEKSQKVDADMSVESREILLSPYATILSGFASNRGNIIVI